MLSISPQQMGHFEEYSHRRYVQSLARHLRTRFEERAAKLSDERLEQLVEDGIQQAKRHGVVFKDDIRRYLEYMVIYGTPLDALPQMPWLGKILNRDSLSGSQKLNLIGEHELAALRGQA